MKKSNPQNSNLNKGNSSSREVKSSSVRSNNSTGGKNLNLNSANKKIPEEQPDTYEKDEKYAEDRIIQKVMKKGFESLSLEELAVTLISPSFELEYQSKTGQDWSKDYKLKAVERLNYAKFNIQWNTSNSSNNVKAPFGLIFELVEKGDIQRVTEYMRKNAQYNEELLTIVDKNKKSPLHIAAKCGHTNLSSVLISRGYSVHMRDKFLRTPLHTACQYGRGTVAEVLINSESDIYARDSIGRTCLHYAACANSAELVVLILGIDPDLVHTKDTYGRTPLHYVVWNSNFNQLEIARRILDSNCEIDALDEEGLTPLHYAADAGKGKIIPILLKRGANPFIRDGRTQRTALEMAVTQHIKEIIIVYSSKPYNASKEDIDDMQLTGNKIQPEEMKNDETRGRQKSQPKKKILASVEEVRESIDNDITNLNNVNDFLFKSQKEKLVSYLKNIQEYGVKSMQHLSKPSLYSGSWLESVNNIDDLFKAINTCSPTEAVLKIFNILSPYKNTFPQPKGEESDMANFFNETDRKNLQSTQKTNFSSEQNFNGTNTFPNPELKCEIEKQNKFLDTQKSEINELKDEIKNLKKTLQGEEDNKRSLVSTEYVNELKAQILKLETENNNLRSHNEKLIENIKSLSDNVSSYKYTIEESKRREDQSRRLVDNLTTQIKEMRNEVTRIQENEKKTLQSNLSNNIGFGIKTQTLIDNSNKDFTLNEEKSIYVFLQLVEDKSLGLDDLLTKLDKDNDLHIFKNEMINLLEDLKLPMEDRSPVIKLSGFSDTKMRMPIRAIIDNFYKREERKFTKLNELLFKLAYVLHNKYIDVEKVYEFLKLNDEKTLSYSELRQGLNSLDITYPENDCETLFRCLCIKDDNKISLDELAEKLRIRKKILDEIGNVDEKLRFSLKDKENDIPLRETVIMEDYAKGGIEVKKDLKSSRNYDYYDMMSSNRNKIKEQVHEGHNYNEGNKKNENLNLNTEETVKINTEEDHSVHKSEENLNDDNIINDETPIEESIKQEKDESPKASTPIQSKNKKAPSDQVNSHSKINGELKIQVKGVENILLPTSLPKPYTLFLTGNLKGVDVEVDSKEIHTDNVKKIDFNWATRIMIKNKTLTEVGSLFKLELKVRTNNKLPVAVGECQLNWTSTLLPKNADVFVINDRFQLLSKRMSNVGIIQIQAKFIPFGTVNSLYDKNGKKNKIPNSLKGLLNKNLLEMNSESKIEEVKGPENKEESIIEEKNLMKSISIEVRKSFKNIFYF
jgi:ankyrin repeat protein